MFLGIKTLGNYLNLKWVDVINSLSSGNKERVMNRYVCKECGHVYYPEGGVPNRISSSNLVQDFITSYSEPVTPEDDSGVIKFENLPEEWVCPVCSATKDEFELKN